MKKIDFINILRNGVNEWNNWREKFPDIYPDLTKADLSEMDLKGINFSKTILRKTNLNFSNLSSAVFFKANLRYVDFGDSNLTKTNFLNADLFKANFRDANLTNSNLVSSNLSNSDFRRAILINTNFSKAVIGWTVFGDADLSKAFGLETTSHHGPSTIGIDTLLKSKGKIPQIFLRRTGIPQNLIDSFTSLAMRPFYYSCFISYSSKDHVFAERLYTDLLKDNVSCWFAPENLKIGDKIRQSIDDSIHENDKLLLVLSENSIDSEWVEKEVETAFEKERRTKQTVLFPIRLDEAIMEIDQSWAADIRRTRNIGNFSKWNISDEYQKSFEKLLTHLFE